MKGLRSKVQTKLMSKTRVSAVAAVRGAKQGGDAAALYWKGGVSEKAQKKLKAEKQQLLDAVQLVMDGDIESGRKALSGFEKENPDSVFAQDARDALARLPAAGNDAEAASPPENKAEKGGEDDTGGQ
ncbi:MAG: hypothetical protein HY550_10815 [Elusimicrobia bacterium]|nr:hypothetical protein [Elusimicrobiota bacterium]